MLEISGLTFEEVCQRLAPRPGQRPYLRRHYEAVLRGAVSSGPLTLTLPEPTRVQRDGGLTKFCLPTSGAFETESVILPMQRNHRCWKSICLSSQVGCAMGCTFCETAQIGLRQQLSAGEIVAQLCAAWRWFGGQIRNVVFMGMGEPLDNFDAVVQAIRVLSDPAGLSIAKERITVSTVGRVDGIRKLAALGWRRLNLAVSLNAPNDEIRRQIMPINRAHPMAELRAALLEYPLRNCQFIMMEYVLIPGVNDAPQHAHELADWCRGIPCCVNVIPYNPRRESPWPAPDEATVQRFMDDVAAAGQPVKRRVTKGRDLMAACGQLGNRAFARQGRLQRSGVSSISTVELPVSPCG